MTGLRRVVWIVLYVVHEALAVLGWVVVGFLLGVLILYHVASMRTAR